MRAAITSLRDPAHLALVAICALLALDNFRLFHAVTELFCVGIAVQMFVVSWKTQGFARSRVLFYLGSGFLWVGLLDLVHALAQEGMGIVDIGGLNSGAHLLMAARITQVMVVLSAAAGVAANAPAWLSFTVFGLFAGVLGGGSLIGVLPTFPTGGERASDPSVVADYGLIGLFFVSAFFAARSRQLAVVSISGAMALSAALMGGSELALSFQLGLSDLVAAIGHLLKFSSFYVLFRGVVTGGFQYPAERLKEEVGRRKDAELDALEKGRRLSEAISATGLGTWQWALDTGDVEVDEAWPAITGVRHSSRLTLEAWFQEVHPADVGRARVQAASVLAGEGDGFSIEVRVLHRDGHWVWVGIRGRVVEWFPDGRPRRASGTLADVTERVERSKQLELAAKVFEVAREGILIADADANIISANRAVTEITGFENDEVIGNNPRLFNSGLQSREFYEEMWRSLLGRGYWEGEVWNRHKSGKVYAELLKVVALRSEAGAIENFISLFSDITRQKEHQKELERVAYFDVLTGLPNRVLLADRLRQAILEAKRQRGISACFYLDIDGFKSINEAYGHSFGDRLLIAVGERLRALVRETDTLSRISGDEFVGVVVDMDDENALDNLLARLIRLVSEPFKLEETVVAISVSVGVSVFPGPGAYDADLLLRQADQAMYQSKLRGRNNVTFFDEESDRSVRVRYEHIADIKAALAAGEFRLFYQPKADLSQGRIVGAEALIRWQSPSAGLLGPGEFLPFIDAHPLAFDLGEWVIRTALAQMTAWRSMGIEMPVSVNVDAPHLCRPDFAARLQAILAEFPDVEPRWLDIEILETSSVEDEEAAIRTITECIALGVSFSLDDFGTGYSSLSYLRRMPVRQIKIDQSFVRDMLENPRDMAIVEGIIKLAGAFGMKVIAEGVETAKIQAALLGMGCYRIQGYHLSPPLPAEEFRDWLIRWDAAGKAASGGDVVLLPD